MARSIQTYIGVRLAQSAPVAITPVTGAVSSSTNLTQIQSVPVDQGAGASTPGTQRVVLSADSGANANLALEAGGNLSALVALTQAIASLLELETRVAAELRALRLQAAVAWGVDIDPDAQLRPDVPVN